MTVFRIASVTYKIRSSTQLKIMLALLSSSLKPLQVGHCDCRDGCRRSQTVEPEFSVSLRKRRLPPARRRSFVAWLNALQYIPPERQGEERGCDPKTN
jgi:hypothetical protein